MSTREFIDQIIENQNVYILTSDEGFAISASEEFEYEDGSNLEVICFWSSEEKANEARKNQWANHKVESLALNVFLEEWLFGMIEEVSIAGLGFNAEPTGIEVSPIDLIIEIAHILNLTKANYTPLHSKGPKDIMQVALEIKESIN